MFAYVCTPYLGAAHTSVPGCSDPRGHPADLDQLETHRLDAVEQSVQSGLVLDLTDQNRATRLNVRAELLEVREQSARDSALHPDLVECSHLASLQQSDGLDVTPPG